MSISDGGWDTSVGVPLEQIALVIASVPAGATIVLGIRNATNETATIDSVTGTLNVSGWTSADGPIDSPGSTMRTWLYYLLNSAAGSETVTVDFSGSINCSLAGGWISSDAGPITFEQAGTARTDQTGTDHDSNTVVATAPNGGCIIGLIVHNNGITFTPDGAGEVQEVASSGRRIAMFSEKYATSGTYGFETTASGATASNFHIAAFAEPSGAAPNFPAPESAILTRAFNMHRAIGRM